MHPIHVHPALQTQLVLSSTSVRAGSPVDGFLEVASRTEGLQVGEVKVDLWGIEGASLTSPSFYGGKEQSAEKHSF